MDFFGDEKLWGDLAKEQMIFCFDEFNRIPLEVARGALSMFDKTMKSAGSNLSIAYTCNPGYAGRIKLPEDLVATNLNIKMTVPDRQAIMEVMLAIEGFSNFETNAENIARILVDCETYLSKQCHYDFGLRAIKSIIRTAGGLLKSDCSETKNDESLAIKNAMLFILAGKTTQNDTKLLSKMIDNFYPGESKFGSLTKTQLFNYMLDIRHAVMAHGPEQKAVEFVEKAVASADENGFKKVEHVTYFGCPDSFYGKLCDLAEGQKIWRDGSFTKILRKYSETTEKVIICITGIENASSPENPSGVAIAMEMLNTLMDDNKVLTLCTGERVPLGENVKICIANGNCDYFSPASVSRLGIVNIE